MTETTTSAPAETTTSAPAETTPVPVATTPAPAPEPATPDPLEKLVGTMNQVLETPVSVTEVGEAIAWAQAQEDAHTTRLLKLVDSDKATATGALIQLTNKFKRQVAENTSSLTAQFVGRIAATPPVSSKPPAEPLPAEPEVRAKKVTAELLDETRKTGVVPPLSQVHAKLGLN